MVKELKMNGIDYNEVSLEFSKELDEIVYKYHILLNYKIPTWSGEWYEVYDEELDKIQELFDKYNL